MSPWVYKLLRVLLILNAGLVGLAGLFMSTCGGMVMMGGGSSGSGLLVLGLACVAATVIFCIWIARAGNRALVVAFVVLVVLPVIALLLKGLRR